MVLLVALVAAVALVLASKPTRENATVTTAPTAIAPATTDPAVTTSATPVPTTTAGAATTPTATSRATIPPAAVAPTASHAREERPVRLPRLVDLGADRCIPCKAMAPILVELRTEYAGRMLTPRRGVAIAGLFSLGLFTTIGVIGVLTAAAGRLLGDVGSWANYVVAAVFFGVGLSLLDVIPLGWGTPSTAPFRGRGLWAALGLGLVFGVALGPCTFAYMAPMLGVTFAVAGTSVLYGVALIAAYGVGHCAVIVLAGASTGWVRRYLHWSDTSRGVTALRYASGLLVLAGGLYLLYTA